MIVNVPYIISCWIDVEKGVVCAVGVWGEVGVGAGEGVARDEATGEDVQEAGVVVVVPQPAHVKERLAGVQAVGYRLLLHSAERHPRGVVVHRLQQHPRSVNYRSCTTQVVTHIVVMRFYFVAGVDKYVPVVGGHFPCAVACLDEIAYVSACRYLCRGLLRIYGVAR